MPEQWFQPSLYDVLLVPREATVEEIKVAYKKLARISHPDLSPDDPYAEERFKRILVAYETLTDPVSRAEYDRELDVPSASHVGRDDQPFNKSDFLAQQRSEMQYWTQVEELYSTRVFAYPDKKNKRPERFVPRWKNVAWRVTFVVSVIGLAIGSYLEILKWATVVLPFLVVMPYVAYELARKRKEHLWRKSDDWNPSGWRRTKWIGLGCLFASPVFIALEVPPVALLFGAVIVVGAYVMWRQWVKQWVVGPSFAPRLNLSCPWGEILRGQTMKLTNDRTVVILCKNPESETLVALPWTNIDSEYVIVTPHDTVSAGALIAEEDWVPVWETALNFNAPLS